MNTRLDSYESDRRGRQRGESGRRGCTGPGSTVKKTIEGTWPESNIPPNFIGFR